MRCCERSRDARDDLGEAEGELLVVNDSAWNRAHRRRVREHPDVLKEPNRVVLERFHEHQRSVSFWFTVLALSAALFAPIAIGVGKLRSNHYMRVAVPIGIAAAVVHVIGLSRWPLLVPDYASDAINANAATAVAAADRPR